MSQVFHTVLTQPLLNILIWLYDILPGNDIGLAIIVLTLIIRALLFPSFQKSLRAQRQLQQLQPKLDELKKRHKDDQEAQAKAMMEFYKENKISPFSSCLPLLIQLPILIALFLALRTGLNGDISGELYPFVNNPGSINTNFFGFLDLATPNFFLALLAGALQFVQSKMMTPKNTTSTDKTQRIMSAQLTYFMPILTVIFASNFPAGLALYWAVTTLFAIGQQYYIIKKP
jgi:YidC/Oxa1 family membrane protein insertase